MFKINDIFFSLQGEGRHVGQPAVFLRLQACNLTCPFCDSRETWKLKEKFLLPPKDLVTTLENVVTESKVAKPLLVITGGEPLLQEVLIQDFLKLKSTQQLFSEVVIETNGTLITKSMLELIDMLEHIIPIQLSISPKWEQVERRKGVNFNHMDILPSKTTFKLVVHDYKDYQMQLQKLDTLLGQHQYKIFIQPMNSSLEIARELIKGGLKHNLSLQIHKLLGVK